VSGPVARGGQLERTALSWQRTALSASVVALFLLREGLTRGAVLIACAGLCVVALAMLAAVAARTGRPACRRLLVLAGAALVAAAGILTVAQVLAGL
jgi:hypothetical protein